MLVLSAVLFVLLLMIYIAKLAHPGGPESPPVLVLVFSLLNCVAWNWIRKDPDAARTVLPWLVLVQAVAAGLDTVLAYCHSAAFFKEAQPDLIGLWIVFPLANALPLVIAWMVCRRD